MNFTEQLREESQEKIAEMTEKVLAFLRPKEPLSVSEWAAKNRYIPRDISAKSGRWNNDFAPYQKHIMEAVTIKGIDTIVVEAGSQIGKTEIELNIVGYFIDHDPSNLMVVLPTLSAAENWSKERLNTMINSTDCLRGKVLDEKSRDSDNTILNKKFEGGRITLSGANSPTSLASRPVRVVVFDEVSKYSASAASEGDPVSLAKERANTFYNRLFIMVSTPGDLETCRIHSEYEQSDKRRLFISCPHCGFKQTLEWENMRWEPGVPDTARFLCVSCNGEITEKHKYNFLKHAEFIPTEPGKNNKKIGFHISALYSPFMTFADIVRKYEAAKDDVLKLKVFVTSVLARPWHEAQEKIEHTALYMRRENYTADVPDGVLVLTAGIDVQDDRLCVEVVGFGLENESWSIDYYVLWGDPSEKDVWDRIDDLRKKEFTHESGFPMRITAMAIDSGGHHTSQVYDFCRERQKHRVFAIKGFSGFGRAVVGAVSRRKSGQEERNCDLFPVGTEVAKMLLYEHLKRQKVGANYCHFPNKDKYSEEYFKELTSENIEVKFVKGLPVKTFILPRGRRNEALDCRVYAIAALNIISIDWEALNMNIDAKKTKEKTANTPHLQEKKENRVDKEIVKMIKRRNSFIYNW